MEAIHIELSNKAIDVFVSEVPGENLFLKLINFFDGKLPSIAHPMNDPLVFIVVQNLETLLDEVSHRVIVVFV